MPVFPRCYTTGLMRPLPLFTGLFLSSCLLVAPACSTEDGAARSAEPAAPEAAERPIPPTSTAPVAPADVEEPPIVTNNRAENAAFVAAEHAPAGRDTCETAVIGLTAMLDAAQSESAAGTELPRPHREDFVTACRALPQPAQQCLVPVYAMAHQEDCERVLGGLPEGRLDALQAAMEIQPNE